MDGRTDRRTEGWLDGQKSDGLINERTERQIGGPSDQLKVSTDSEAGWSGDADIYFKLLAWLSFLNHPST